MSRALSATIHVERGEEEVEVDLSATISRYVPARVNCSIENSHPAEGGELEDVEATVDGKPFELTDAERERAEQALYDAAED